MKHENTATMSEPESFQEKCLAKFSADFEAAAAKMAARPKKLKKGAKIRVYEKPLTGEGLEGIATLHRHEGYHGESYYPNGPEGKERMIYLWSVHFDGESRVVDRRVSPDDLL